MVMSAFDEFDEFDAFEDWPPEQVGNICAGCDLPAVVNDLGLCGRCNAKLERDLIRDRDWDRSATAFLTPDDKREELRARVIREYGAAYELIEPLGGRTPKKKRKQAQPPKRNRRAEQPQPPPEPVREYAEEDILAAIETVIRATTKAYGWRHLGDIGQYLHRANADFEPATFGSKNLLQFIEKHPERFKVKWSAPSHKGASHVWVRLAAEPKRKEGYSKT
jgi:hypothetical protein